MVERRREKGMARVTRRDIQRADAVREVNAFRPLVRVLVINDNHCGLTFLFEL
jgi:hypothetical protein